MYVYETHLHTSEASACGRWDGAQAARACHAAGYTGIVVTNHFVYGNTSVDRSLPWGQWVDVFESGYLRAKAEGDRIGLQVFFGWESGYDGTEFLIYGLDADWLRAHPEIRDATVAEQAEWVRRDGGLIVHAHPFREEPYIPEIRLFPDLVDAVEVGNATHSNPGSLHHNKAAFDRAALAYAREQGLAMTAGSDIHSRDMLYGGMGFYRKMADVGDFVRAVKTREPCFLYDGASGAPGW